jgi:hypothetical protein
MLARGQAVLKPSIVNHERHNQEQKTGEDRWNYSVAVTVAWGMNRVGNVFVNESSLCSRPAMGPG